MKVPVLAMLLFAAAPLHAANWNVDKSQTTIGFTGAQSGAAFAGRFTRFAAAIDFDPAHPEQGHAAITVDMASAVSADKQRDEALPDSDWFDTAKFPQAVFKVDRFNAQGGDAYEAVGTLNLRGVEKPARLPFTLRIEGDKAVADGTLTLNRQDFGVGQGDWASDQWVAFQVGVPVHVVAVKAP